jgi:hypothetical protein
MSRSNVRQPAPWNAGWAPEKQRNRCWPGTLAQLEHAKTPLKTGLHNIQLLDSCAALSLWKLPVSHCVEQAKVAEKSRSGRQGRFRCGG